MDFGKYEKYMNDRKAVTVENNRRIEKKFAECEKWVADNLINCGCVFTNHSELLQKQSFMIWIDNGISISHNLNDPYIETKQPEYDLLIHSSSHPQ